MAGLSASSAFDGVDGNVHDLLIEARAHGRDAPEQVVVVEVDQRTVAREGRLPLDRRTYAKTIDRLTQLGAKVIVIDVQFTEQSDDLDADEALLVAMEDSPVPIVLATSLVDDSGDTTVMGGKRLLVPAGAVAAHSSFPLDPDGPVRRIQRTIAGIPTLAQAAAEAAGRPGLPQKTVLLDPTVPGTRLNHVSLLDVLGQDLGGRRASFDPARLRGRVAVVGLTTVDFGGEDTQYMAGTSQQVFGAELQAQAIDTALRGEPLRGTGAGVAWLLALLAGLLAAMGARRSLWVQLGSALAALALLVVVSYVAVRSGVLLEPIRAIAVLVLSALGVAAARAAVDRRRRAAASATLGRFVPPGVVDDLLDSDRDGLIAPRAQQATVVFCDLRGYTSLVASLKEPAALISILDAYLSAVTETVHRHGGTVVSFQGDGVMSAFGTPVPTDESPAQAVAAARELQTRALPQVRAELAAIVEGAEDLKLGIGVATGPVFAGTVGPAERREYAVVGPTTNLAARLQALTKTEGVDVILDGATAAGAGAPENARAHTGIVTVDDVGLRSLGPREVRGLTAPVDVWTLAQPGDESPARPAA